jgi:hypothetical protein
MRSHADSEKLYTALENLKSKNLPVEPNDDHQKDMENSHRRQMHVSSQRLRQQSPPLPPRADDLETSPLPNRPTSRQRFLSHLDSSPWRPQASNELQKLIEPDSETDMLTQSLLGRHRENRNHDNGKELPEPMIDAPIMSINHEPIENSHLVLPGHGFSIEVRDARETVFVDCELILYSLF